MADFKRLLEKQEKIACLLAVYEKNLGNCTKVIFATGKEILLPRSVDSTLRTLARHYSVDLKQLRKNQQNLLNCRNYVTLPIHRDLLLIPIKTRIPRVKKDPSVSYINYYEIEKLDSRKPVIYLKNKYAIESLNSLHLVRKRYNWGKITAKFYNRDHTIPDPILDERPPTYYYPATKGDIQYIAEAIRDLKDLLRGLYVKKE